MRRLLPRHYRLFVGFTVALHGAIALPGASFAQMQTEHGGQPGLSGSAALKLGNLTVTLPWTRATPGGAKIAGGYLKINNAGSAPDRFIGARAEVADHAEIHEMSMSDGVMKMRPLPNGLEIKPGETVELKPGGYHLMFMDLKQPLKAGETFRATLQFEKAGSLDVNFAVNPLGATAPQH